MKKILNANQALCLKCQATGCKQVNEVIRCHACGTPFMINKKTKQPFKPIY